MRVRPFSGSVGPMALAALAALIVAGQACGEAPAGALDNPTPAMVVTQIPPGSGGDVTLRPALDARFPPGSRIVLVRDGESPPRLLSRGFLAAGAPALSPDGASIVFAGRERSGSPWAIFELSLRRGRPRKVVESDRDCGDPAYLAGERVVFACAPESPGASAPSPPTWSLYTAPLRGGAVERITFGAGSAFDPHPLEDGRILFSMRPVDRPNDRTARLFTVNPDGSLLSPLTDDHEAREFRFRPRTATGSGMVFLAARSDGERTRAHRVDLGRPLNPRRDVLRSLEPSAVELLAGGDTLVSGRPHPPTTNTAAVWRRHADDDRLEVVFDSPDWDEVEALAVESRPRPRGRPSGLNLDRRTGTLICYDTGRTDGTIGPAPDAPPAATLAVQSLRSVGGGKPERVVDLGEVRVEPDGSVFLEVPPDVPIRVRSLDDGGREIATSGWFWVRPGETRACFGCHESQETAPVNRSVAALAHGPARLSGARP